MLKHNKKYTFRFGDKKIVINQNYNESDTEVYAKALVYELYHRQYRSMRLQGQVDERFQPDLSAADYDGSIIFWGECGNVSPNKIEKLFRKYRKALFVFVKEERDIPLFKKQLEKCTKDLHTLPLVDIVIYPPRFAEWWVSEQGDVYLPREKVTIIRWP